jgi:hypothetical protein
MFRIEPAFDIGITNPKSLYHYIKSSRMDVFIRRKMHQSNPISSVPSNGSIMRLAPIVLLVI